MTYDYSVVLFREQKEYQFNSNSMAGLYCQALESNGTKLGLSSTTVRFEHIEVEGFGPFKNACRYPLHKQGIRVISGRNLDDVSSESNGAGKSMLVTAPLWAVTGRLDARAEVCAMFSKSWLHYHLGSLCKVVRATFLSISWSGSELKQQKSSLQRGFVPKCMEWP